MTDASAGSLKQLAQTVFKDRDPNARKAALLDIREYDHPRVLELFELVSQKDPDNSVRDLAANLASQRRTEALLHPDRAAARQERHDRARKTSAGIWFCEFCGAENTGNSCVTCAAARPDSAPTPAGTLNGGFDLAPGTFLIEPRNLKFINGTGKAVGGQWPTFGIIVLLLFLVAGLIMIGFGARDMYLAGQLDAKAVPIDGQITGRHISESEDGSNTYYVHFGYTANGVTYQTQQSVSRSLYNDAETGRTIRVEYLPSDPAVARIAGSDGYGVGPLLLGFGLLWNVITGVMLLSIVLYSSRYNRLAREGQLIQGKLMSARTYLDSDNDRWIQIEYLFPDPAGSGLISGKVKQICNHIGDRIPARGVPVVVLYRNPNHFTLL
jgi:hypothetical protein